VAGRFFYPSLYVRVHDAQWQVKLIEDAVDEHAAVHAQLQRALDDIDALAYHCNKQAQEAGRERAAFQAELAQEGGMRDAALNMLQRLEHEHTEALTQIQEMLHATDRDLATNRSLLMSLHVAQQEVESLQMQLAEQRMQTMQQQIPSQRSVASQSNVSFNSAIDTCAAFELETPKQEEQSDSADEQDAAWESQRPAPELLPPQRQVVRLAPLPLKLARNVRLPELKSLRLRLPLNHSKGRVLREQFNVRLEPFKPAAASSSTASSSLPQLVKQEHPVATLDSKVQSPPVVRWHPQPSGSRASSDNDRASPSLSIFDTLSAEIDEHLSKVALVEELQKREEEKEALDADETPEAEPEETKQKSQSLLDRVGGIRAPTPPAQRSPSHHPSCQQRSDGSHHSSSSTNYSSDFESDASRDEVTEEIEEIGAASELASTSSAPPHASSPLSALRRWTVRHRLLMLQQTLTFDTKQPPASVIAAAEAALERECSASTAASIASEPGPASPWTLVSDGSSDE
jgi:hypothetical protein